MTFQLRRAVCTVQPRNRINLFRLFSGRLCHLSLPILMMVDMVVTAPTGFSFMMIMVVATAAGFSFMMIMVMSAAAGFLMVMNMVVSAAARFLIIVLRICHDVIIFWFFCYAEECAGACCFINIPY